MLKFDIKPSYQYMAVSTFKVKSRKSEQNYFRESDTVFFDMLTAMTPSWQLDCLKRTFAQQGKRETKYWKCCENRPDCFDLRLWTYTQTDWQTHKNTHTHTPNYTCTHTHTLTHTHTHTHKHKNTQAQTYTHTHIHTYTHTHIHTYTHTHTHTHTHTTNKTTFQFSLRHDPKLIIKWRQTFQSVLFFFSGTAGNTNS